MWNIEKIVKKGDYLYCVVKGHPRASVYGYVLHHRVIMENHLGRLLNDDEVVHHKDGNKHNNVPDNLEVMNNREHSKEHGLHVGRAWVKLKCPSCGSVFERPKNATHLNRSTIIGVTSCSYRCKGIFLRKIQLHGKTPEVERAISENILLEYKKYLRDNAEETATTGSVETIRTSSEMMKT